jgi:hypothetical protein
MIPEFVPNLSVTMDTAFRKRFNPAGVHKFTHTCQPTLNGTGKALFLGGPGEGGWPWSLPYFRLEHESRPKDCSAIMGQVPKSVLKDVNMDQDCEGRAFLNPCHILIWCTSSTISFQNIFNAYAKCKSWSMWLIEQTRQVS